MGLSWGGRESTVYANQYAARAHTEGMLLRDGQRERLCALHMREDYFRCGGYSRRR